VKHWIEYWLKIGESEELDREWLVRSASNLLAEIPVFRYFDSTLGSSVYLFNIIQMGRLAVRCEKTVIQVSAQF
jgi:hypothetical protein